MCRKSKEICFHPLKCHYVDRDTVDGIATYYGLDAQWIKSQWRRDLPDTHTPTMGTTHPPIQWQPELFHQPTLMHNFLYSLTICLLHYYPRHVSSINMPIFKRKNCIHTASGIFALCKRLHSTLVESGLQDNSETNILLMNKENCALKLVDEIILYYDARSKKHQMTTGLLLKVNWPGCGLNHAPPPDTNRIR